jgi:mannose-6-phosphate isomerase-like protein (cupin superfamily)
MLRKVNLAEKLRSFSDHWTPRIVGELAGCHVKLVKFQGEFVWHAHEEEDELFLVLAGQFIMRLQDQEITLSEGDLLIIPRGVEHQPVAAEEVSVLLFEPASTVNTGALRTEGTVLEPERI